MVGKNFRTISPRWKWYRHVNIASVFVEKHGLRRKLLPLLEKPGWITGEFSGQLDRLHTNNHRVYSPNNPRNEQEPLNI